MKFRSRPIIFYKPFLVVLLIGDHSRPACDVHSNGDIGQPWRLHQRSGLGSTLQLPYLYRGWRSSSSYLGHPIDTSSHWRPHTCVHGAKWNQPDPMERPPAWLDRNLLPEKSGDSANIILKPTVYTTKASRPRFTHLCTVHGASFPKSTHVCLTYSTGIILCVMLFPYIINISIDLHIRLYFGYAWM